MTRRMQACPEPCGKGPGVCEHEAEHDESHYCKTPREYCPGPCRPVEESTADTKLLPCPCCDCRAHTRRNEVHTHWLCECASCGLASQWYPSEEAAVAAWNRRVPAEPCKECETLTARAVEAEEELQQSQRWVQEAADELRRLRAANPPSSAEQVSAERDEREEALHPGSVVTYEPAKVERQAWPVEPQTCGGLWVRRPDGGEMAAIVGACGHFGWTCVGFCFSDLERDGALRGEGMNVFQCPVEDNGTPAKWAIMVRRAPAAPGAQDGGTT